MGEPIPTGALNVPSSVINTESTIYELKLSQIGKSELKES